jgi:hypothetical protein
MNPHPATSELREAIDACRPGSADLSLPEFARLAEAIERDPAVAAELARGQRFDGLVAEALDDVPVPAGLAERLLAKAASSRLSTAVHSATESAATEAAAGELATPADRSSRRRWLWRVAGAGLATAAVAVLAVFAGPLAWGPATPRKVSTQDLLAEVDTWMNSSSQDNAGWQKMTTRAPAGFSRPSAVIRPPRQWLSFKTGGGDAAVAYDLSAAGSRATLFVVETKARYPVGPLPYSTVPGATGGRQIAGWQSPTHLYVLVVDQGRTPDEYLRRPSVG